MTAAARAKIPKSERTRAEILHAAEHCFAARGFARTRLDDIGDEAGIAGTAILYHYKDKRELYRAVLTDCFSGLLAALQGTLAGHGTLVQRIEALVSVIVDYVGNRPTAARLALREASTDDPEQQAELRAYAAPFLELLTHIFEEGERSGVIQPIRSDPFHFVSALAGTVVFYVAALPTFVSDLPYDHLAPDQLKALERDALNITRRLLGISGPRSTRRSPQSKEDKR